MFSHHVSTTPSSAHQAGPLCFKCPKSFLEVKAGLGLDSFPFLPTLLLPQAEELREGYVGRRTGEDACLFGDGLNRGRKVQEPLKDKRVHRGVICRTGESERRRKMGIEGIPPRFPSQFLVPHFSNSV